MNPLIKDLTGQKFGRLLVQTYEPILGSGAHWNCLCDCGKICVKSARVLRKGTKSCGCLNTESAHNFTDITGLKFGEWTADSYAYSTRNGRYWSCTCSCGTVRPVAYSELNTGRATACGCVRASATRKRCFIDHTGKQYGRLTVQYLMGKEEGHYRWLCTCSCGKYKVVSSRGLGGGTKSCGCISKEHDFGRGSRLQADAARCLYLVKAPEYSDVFKVGLAKPEVVKYRTWPSGGGFVFIDAALSTNEQARAWEKEILKNTATEAWIPPEYQELAGKTEIRKGFKIVKCYEKVTGRKVSVC